MEVPEWRHEARPQYVVGKNRGPRIGVRTKRGRERAELVTGRRCGGIECFVVRGLETIAVFVNDQFRNAR